MAEKAGFMKRDSCGSSMALLYRQAGVSSPRIYTSLMADGKKLYWSSDLASAAA